MKYELCNLPREIISIANGYLDLEDLKKLSSTCCDMDRISWKTRREISKIRINSGIAMEIFKKTGKVFNNFLVVGAIDPSDLLTMECVNITFLEFNSMSSLRTSYSKFEMFKENITKVRVRLDCTIEDVRSICLEIESLFPRARIDNKVHRVFQESTTFQQLYADSMYPTEMTLYNCENLKIDKDNYSLKKLTASFINKDLLHMKNLHELYISDSDLEQTEKLIEVNQTTLIKLTVVTNNNWNYKLPCQLKELQLFNIRIFQSSWLAEFLKEQRCLRKLSLMKFHITAEVISIFMKNKTLTSIELNYCEIKGDKAKTMSFPLVQNVLLYNVDIHLINAVLRNPDSTSLFVVAPLQLNRSHMRT
jgi:hypothetical protein